MRRRAQSSMKFDHHPVPLANRRNARRLMVEFEGLQHDDDDVLRDICGLCSDIAIEAGPMAQNAAPQAQMPQARP